jgi:O-antigen ligase
LCLVMPVAFAVFLLMSRLTSKREKFFLVAITLVLTLAVATTLSRGGMVGYAAVMAVIIWFSKKKMRIIFALALLLGASIPFLPSTFFSEASSIQNEQDGTAVDRLRSWKMGWLMFMDYPLAGVGAANFPFRVLEYERQMPDYNPHGGNHAGRVAHSLWFTLIPEYGLIGTVVYLWMVFGVVSRCRKIADNSAKDSDEVAEIYSVVAKGTIGALVGFLVSGTFIAVLYYPHFWYLLGFCIGVDIGYQDHGGLESRRPCRSFSKSKALVNN